jgi:hypothetical protein
MRGSHLAALALLLCASPAVADNPKKVAIGPGSPKGALLFTVPPLAVDYQLLFTPTDKKASSSREYWVFVKAVPREKGERFIVTSLPPGEYLLEGLYQQRKWVACLQAKTMLISIEPGRIAYLGYLDARPTLASIQRNAEASKELVAHYGDWHFYRTDVAAPRVSGRDDGGLARAEAFVRKHMPRSSASPGLAGLRWLPYEIVGTTGGANRCV